MITVLAIETVGNGLGRRRKKRETNSPAVHFTSSIVAILPTTLQKKKNNRLLSFHLELLAGISPLRK
jgi:hypothetical protein